MLEATESFIQVCFLCGHLNVLLLCSVTHRREAEWTVGSSTSAGIRTTDSETACLEQS